MGAGGAKVSSTRSVDMRREQTVLRVAATALIAFILQTFVHFDWVWAWAALYTVALGVELRVSKPAFDNPGIKPSRGRLMAMAVTTAMTSVIFGALSLPLFSSDQRFAPTLGGMLLAGALLNVIVVNGTQRSATLAAAAPHVIYLMIVPFIGKAANPDAPLANALWFGALLLVVSVAVASRTLASALQAEADAKHEAELRRIEAEEAVAAKSAFVAMISHELRTPISAILAGAARLHSEMPDAGSKVHAQLISDAGGLMRNLLNDLLDFSRLDAGRMAVEKVPFNLRQTLADTLRLWRPEAARKGLRLRLEGAPRLPRWVAGDAMRLRQVLNNLLSNAVKFTAQGSVTVRLACEPEGSGYRLSLAVVDTGPGIPAPMLTRLFTPFEQLDASIVRQHGGSGLGLVISRQFAQLMGGDLTATSVDGQGATFTLSLMLEATEPPEASEAPCSLAGARVLVVDDHVVNRRAIELVLQPFGIEAVLAESGEQALERLGTEVFDAVLMDLYMPGMDGRDATRALRSGNSPNRDTPVIAVTASSTPKDWEACRAAGMNGHVAKPVDPIELHAALCDILPDVGRSAAA